jgi:integrase/recombinase XerC
MAKAVQLIVRGDVGVDDGPGLYKISPHETLAQALLGRLRPATVRTYRQGLKSLGRFLGSGESPAEVVRAFYKGNATQVAGRLMRYKASLAQAGLSRNTINTRLAALGRMHVLAKSVLPGCGYELPFKALRERQETYRDTSGCGRPAFLKALATTRGDGAKSARDRAILLLMYQMGLRNNEVRMIDREDFDGTVLHVQRKRDEGKTPLTPHKLTARAIQGWLGHRGDHPGPMFQRLDPAGRGGRITNKSLWKVVWARGKSAGVPSLYPHQLRHSAITEALEKYGGDITKVQDFSGHADLNTLKIYNDNRGRFASAVGQAVGDDLEKAIHAED